MSLEVDELPLLVKHHPELRFDLCQMEFPFLLLVALAAPAAFGRIEGGFGEVLFTYGAFHSCFVFLAHEISSKMFTRVVIHTMKTMDAITENTTLVPGSQVKGSMLHSAKASTPYENKRVMTKSTTDIIIGFMVYRFWDNMV